MAWSRNRGSAGHSRVEGRLTRGDSAIPRRGELRTAAPSFFHALARPTGRDTAAAHEEPQGQGRGDCRVGCAQSSSGFAGVFERGGREPMGGSVGSAGEDLLVGLREVGSVGRIAGTTPEFNSDGPHTSGDGPDELKVP
jgi:hypothetical protein